MRKPPRFWTQPAGSIAALLAPVSALYSAGSRLREVIARPYRAPVPLICIGNPTLGGAGKTPTAILIAERLAGLGAAPHFISKGYGGTATGPLTVDRDRDLAAEVGDEPLLLAAAAPTHVAKSRADGAAFAAAAGADIIVMDDGFQNPTVHKDVAILVVDGGAGVGNGRVFPAGPLRAPIDAQLARADAFLVIGRGEVGDGLAAKADAAGIPVLTGRLVPGGAPDRLVGERFVAFAGIGRPDKFYASLEEAGGIIVARRDFADHHAYGADDIGGLIALAERHGGAQLMTTEKDFARFDEANDTGGAFRATLRTLPVRLEIDDLAALDALLGRCLPDD